MIIVDDAYNGVVEVFGTKKGAQDYIANCLEQQESCHENDFTAYDGKPLTIKVEPQKIMVSIVNNS